jgi:His/Glu/Gln/Arg/opine family amino acid ABC transporter permease subunit
MGELWGVLTNHFSQFASGFLMTLKIISVSFLVAIIVGTVVAAFRVTPSRVLRAIGTTYVEIFRNIPLLVLIYIIFLGLRRAGYEIEREPSAWAALGLYTAAYVAEAIRSGIFAVGKGQIDASLALGFTYSATLRKVVLPQAVRTVIPPLGNITIAMIKNSAIIGVSILALRDLLKEARNVHTNTFQTNEAFFWAAVGYLLLTVTATFVVRSLEKRLAVRR